MQADPELITDAYYVNQGLERVPLTHEDKVDIANAWNVEFRAIHLGGPGKNAAAEGARKSVETRRRILEAHGFEPGTEVVRWGDAMDLAIWARKMG